MSGLRTVVVSDAEVVRVVALELPAPPTTAIESEPVVPQVDPREVVAAGDVLTLDKQVHVHGQAQIVQAAFAVDAVADELPVTSRARGLDVRLPERELVAPAVGVEDEVC